MVWLLFLCALGLAAAPPCALFRTHPSDSERWFFTERPEGQVLSALSCLWLFSRFQTNLQEARELTDFNDEARRKYVFFAC